MLSLQSAPDVCVQKKGGARRGGENVIPAEFEQKTGRVGRGDRRGLIGDKDLSRGKGLKRKRLPSASGASGEMHRPSGKVPHLIKCARAPWDF